VFVELDRFFQTGQPPPQVGLVHHLTLVLHDLVSGFGHNVLDLRGGGWRGGEEIQSVSIFKAAEIIEIQEFKKLQCASIMLKK